MNNGGTGDHTDIPIQEWEEEETGITLPGLTSTLWLLLPDWTVQI